MLQRPTLTVTPFSMHWKTGAARFFRLLARVYMISQLATRTGGSVCVEHLPTEWRAPARSGRVSTEAS